MHAGDIVRLVPVVSVTISCGVKTAPGCGYAQLLGVFGPPIDGGRDLTVDLIKFGKGDSALNSIVTAWRVSWILLHQYG